MITYIDVLILLTVLIFTFFGFKDGFFRKVFSILSLIIGFIIATKFMGVLGKLIIEWFDFSPLFSYLSAFFAILFFVILLFTLIYKWLSTKSTVLKLINRLSGAVLGAVQGILIASLVLLVLKFADIPSEETKNDSLLYKDIVNVTPRIFDFFLRTIPESKSFFEEVQSHLEKYKDKL